MGRLFVVTLGFHEDHVMRRLVSDKAVRSDRVILVTASPVAAATQRAYESLIAACSRMSLPRPELVEVPADPYGGLKTLLSLMIGEDELVVDLSGGMRYLSVYVLLALLLMRRRSRIYLQPESGEVSEVLIPETVIEVFFNPPKPVELELLRLIGSNEGLTTRDLSRFSGRAEKTVMNIVSSLSKRGLILRRGRRGGVFLTSAGRLVLEVLR